MNYDRLWFPSWTNTFYSVTWQRLTKAGHRKLRRDKTKVNQQSMKDQTNVPIHIPVAQYIHTYTCIQIGGYCRMIHADLNSSLLVRTISLSLSIRNNQPSNHHLYRVIKLIWYHNCESLLLTIVRNKRARK